MSAEDKFRHLASLPRVLEVDLDFILVKDRSYGASWKRRGGIGAFMMMARKWDRLEVFMEEMGYDIFRGIEVAPEGEDGSVLAEVRDLRRYLALVEAEMVSRGVVHVKKLVMSARQTAVQGSLDLRPAPGAGGTVPATPPEPVGAAPEPSAPGAATPIAGAAPERPGTPLDGGQHARHEDEEDELPFSRDVRRESFLLTNKEWEMLADETVHAGSATGVRWQDMYRQQDDGRWLMLHTYSEEYGR